MVVIQASVLNFVHPISHLSVSMKDVEPLPLKLSFLLIAAILLTSPRQVRGDTTSTGHVRGTIDHISARSTIYILISYPIVNLNSFDFSVTCKTKRYLYQPRRLKKKVFFSLWKPIFEITQLPNWQLGGNVYRGENVYWLLFFYFILLSHFVHKLSLALRYFFLEQLEKGKSRLFLWINFKSCGYFST